MIATDVTESKHPALTLRTALWIVLAIAASTAILNLIYLWRQIGSPTDTSNPESLIVYLAQRIRNGQPLYTDFHQNPFLTSNFTPVFYFLLAYAGKAFNLSVPQMFLWGRQMSFACAFLTALLLIANERMRGERNSPALMGGLLFLSAYLLLGLANTNRPDIFAAFFSLAGIVLYARSKSLTARGMSIFMFVLAFFTKQSYLSAPLAIVVVALSEKKWKEAIWIAGIFGSVTIAVLGLMHLATDGLSSLNIIELNRLPWRVQNLRLVLFMFLQLSALPLILAAVACSQNSGSKVERSYFATVFLLGVISCARAGSNVNYFLESLVAACLIAPRGIRILVTQPAARVLIAVMFLILNLPALNFLIDRLATFHFEDQREIQSLASSAKGAVISDDPRLILLGQRPFFFDPLTLACLEQTGRWTSAPISVMVNRKEVEFVILRSPIQRVSTWQGVRRLPPDVIRAIQAHYKLQQIVNGYYVYVPTGS